MRDYASSKVMWETLRGFQTHTEALPDDAIQQLHNASEGGGAAA